MADFEHIGAIIQRVLGDLWRQREEAKRQASQREKSEEQGREPVEERK